MTTLLHHKANANCHLLYHRVVVSHNRQMKEQMLSTIPQSSCISQQTNEGADVRLDFQKINLNDSIAVATNSRSMVFVPIFSCVRRCVCVCMISSIMAPVYAFRCILTYQPGFEKKKTNTMLCRVFVFETEPMTVAPSHTAIKNFQLRYRPLSQSQSSLYRERPKSNLLNVPCLKHGRLLPSIYSIERHGRDAQVVDTLGLTTTNEGEVGARLSFAQINYCLGQSAPAICASLKPDKASAEDASLSWCCLPR